MANSVARITLGTLVLVAATAGAAGAPQPNAVLAALSDAIGRRTFWGLAAGVVLLALLFVVRRRVTAPRPTGKHRA